MSAAMPGQIMESDRRRQTALHEAGHAVAHVRLGLEQTGASIIPDAFTLGGAWGEGARQVWDKSQAGPVVLAFCASYAALIAAGYPDDVARAGAGDDFPRAADVMSFWALAGDLDDWLAQAVDLMRRPENVAAVALVAQHLLQRERLDGDYIAVLVELADGDCTEADFARYLQMRGLG